METPEQAIDRLNREMWQPIRDEHQAVHRGFGVELGDEDHALVHDKSRPLHERAARLMEHVSKGHTREDYGWGGDLGGSGLGIHWTTDANVAHHFAKVNASHRMKHDGDADGERYGYNADGFPRQRPETRIVLHAHFPEHEHIAHDEEDQDGAFGWDVRNALHHTENGGGVPGGFEREVPIKRGQPVRVHAISWGLASHRGDDQADHDRETTRYDFPQTLTKKATREPGSVDCWVCGATGDDNQGGECEFCDGSRYLSPGDQKLARCPCGEKITRKADDGDWLTHLDGSTSHDKGDVPKLPNGHYPSVSEAMRMRVLGFKRVAEQTYYHGTSARLAPGDLIHPGHGGSEHEYAFATRSLRHATDFAWEHGTPHVYRVEPTGPHQEVPLARGEVKSKHPYRVLGELPHHEYLGEQGLTEVPAEHLVRHAYRPQKRIFGPTYGLDHRLFDGDHLKPQVREWVLDTLNAFWQPLYGKSWYHWARVYFSGSEASEWTSPNKEGNGDFDVLIGIDFEAARKAVPSFDGLTDDQIIARLNADLTTLLWPRLLDVYIPIGKNKVGPFSVTFFCNAEAWDIRDIKPYAAYNVTSDCWAVKPPHLPGWSLDDFPQGHALVRECRAVEAYVRAVLAMPEPYRSQQADALWRHLHADRGRSFTGHGEGWFDSGNVIEKWLDQKGLWEPLATLHFDAQADAHLLDTPAGWSNDPGRPAA